MVGRETTNTDYVITRNNSSCTPKKVSFFLQVCTDSVCALSEVMGDCLFHWFMNNTESLPWREKHPLISRDSPPLQECVSVCTRVKLTKILLNRGVIEESMMSQGELIPIYWKETLLNKDISVFSEGCVRRSSYSALIMTYFLVVWSLPLRTVTKYLPFTRPLY